MGKQSSRRGPARTVDPANLAVYFDDTWTVIPRVKELQVRPPHFVRAVPSPVGSRLCAEDPSTRLGLVQ